jgi:energy-coupling factor transporter ATP-binding protein EcfA2
VSAGVIDIEKVSFTYSGEGRCVLKNLDLHIATGECVLLCGQSGCGKTTVTKLVNGLIPHFIAGRLDGKVVVAGMDVATTEMYQLAQKIGSVFQNPKSQFFNIDSDSELAFGLENQGLEPELIRNRIAQTVHDLQIEKLTGRNLFEMSGGEKQALAFAAVYALNPDIYVLDEPSANLDVKAIDRLRELLKIIKGQGKTILITEHRLYYLTDLIDRAIFMAEGEIGRIFDREEFAALASDTRKKMGLRTLKPPKLKEALIKSAAKAGGKAELEVNGLCCKYGKKTVLKDVNFAASGGDISGVWGANGAGKTTLMRCLAGLFTESAGHILINGKKTSPKQRLKYNYLIMQDVGHQLFGESVFDECRLADQDLPEEQILKVLREFNLVADKDQHPLALSGGQKQRLAIAVGALAAKKILIFDEPTSGLDYAHMRIVSNMIKRLAGENHIVFVVTHDLEFLELTCNKGIIMDNDK